MSLYRVFIVGLLIYLLASSAGATVYVDAGATGSRHDGTSWATAFTTIGAALASVPSGGNIWVKAGTYRERITLNTYDDLYGGFLGYETSTSQRLPGAFPSIIDAGNKGRAVDVVPGAWATIDGFTIQHGSADRGGGIQCETASVVHITNCRIQFCKATVFAGGVYYGTYSEGVMSNCVISDNQAPNGGGADVEYHSYPTLQGNLIVRNQATLSGGALYCPYHSGADLENCTLAFNSAGLRGGALYADYGGPVKLNYCIVSNNSSPNGGGLFGDGTISQVTFTYTDFFANAGGDWTGSITAPAAYTYNTYVDPRYLMPGCDEFHVLPTSPCTSMGAFPPSSVCAPSKTGVAKQLADGTALTLAAKVVSGVDGPITYVEEPDRTTAIAVTGLSGYLPGDILASVTGTLGTDARGNRLLSATSSTLSKRSGYSFRPFGMTMTGLRRLAVGIYVRVWGKVRQTSTGVFQLTDGSGSPYDPVQNRLSVRYGGTVRAGSFVWAAGVYTTAGDFAAQEVYQAAP